MAAPLVSDELWSRVEPLIPKRHSPGPDGGRPPVDDRAALTGILFVLRSGIPWEMLPQEMHCGCGMTCWRRLRDWQASGVWDKLHAVLLSELNAADKINWSRAALDSSTIRAVGGGEATGPNPTDRARPGSKHHLLVDGHGVPLAETVTGANVPDVKQLLPLVVAVPAARGSPGIRDRDPSDCMETAPTTASPRGNSCDGWGSCRSWPSAARSTAAASASFAGSSNERSAGCTNNADCEFVMSDGQTFTKDSSPSPRA